MKKFVLILFCLTLTASVARAENYTLLAATMWDSGPDGPVSSTVYILQFPKNQRPVVFKEFGSKIMEDWLSSLPRGSVVDFDINTFGKVIPPAQVPQFESLKAACKKKGVSLTLSNGALVIHNAEQE